MFFLNNFQSNVKTETYSSFLKKLGPKVPRFSVSPDPGA
jgi:hypothetical protein